MPKVRSASEIAEKWGRVTPARTEDYEKGVKDPKKDWETQAKGAEGIYKESVIRAANEGRYGRGVSKAGTEKWQRKTIDKGVMRWGPGVSLAEDDYAEGFAPYRDVIERTDIGPRYPKGDPRNIQRVAKLAAALHEKKIKG